MHNMSAETSRYWQKTYWQSHHQQLGSGLGRRKWLPHLLVNIRVSLDDGVAPGLVPLNCSVHHAHAKADIEHVAVASSSRADGLQDQECSVQNQGGQASAGSISILKGMHWPTRGAQRGRDRREQHNEGGCCSALMLENSGLLQPVRVAKEKLSCVTMPSPWHEPQLKALQLTTTARPN